MDQIDLAYWAGIIDGEGSIKLIKRRPLKGWRKTPDFIPYLTVSNTNHEIIMQLKKVWGCGTIWHKKPFKKNHKPALAWYVSSNKCLEILKQVLPFLRIKKKQAELLLEYGKETDRRPRGAVQVSLEELRKRQIFYEKMKILNKRGVVAAD